MANYVGSLVFNKDCKRAEEAFALLGNSELDAAKRNKHILYIQTDGAALNTRLKDEEGSTWHENKLGEILARTISTMGRITRAFAST